MNLEKAKKWKAVLPSLDALIQLVLMEGWKYE